jgi:hypothetical protein
VKVMPEAVFVSIANITPQSAMFRSLAAVPNGSAAITVGRMLRGQRLRVAYTSCRSRWV